MSGKRKWLLRVGLGLVLTLVVGGIWAGMNATALKVRYLAHQLRAATTDDDRSKAADHLINLGRPGLAELVECLRGSDDVCRSAAAAAIDRRLISMPDGDPGAILVASQVLEAFPTLDDGGRRAVLELLPIILKRTGNTLNVKCREAIASELKTSEPTARVLAVRLALHPDLKMRPDLLSLLADPEPSVRRAALFGVASVTDGEPLIADEELFHFLHDPDEGMRKVCYDALVSRDRSEAEIGLARRLYHPDPGERLKLLLDLRYDDDVADPEPWLERLSRDQEPAVRAGAARVVLEVIADRKLTCPGWVAHVVDADPDPTVRRVAAYFRRLTTHPGSGPVRPVGGP